MVQGASGSAPFGRPGTAARWLGRGAGLIDEHQDLAFEPGQPARGDVRALLLERRARFFLKLIPWRSKNRHTVPVPRWSCFAKVESTY